MKIYIARHGQNEDNQNGILNGHRDLPLTELGQKQAHEAAAHISQLGLRFDAVYTSPLARAHETAVVIAGGSHQPVPVVHPLLIERNFGVMTGQPASRIQELCTPDIMLTDTITYFLSPEGAETFPDLIARAKVLLLELETKHSNETVLLVGHCDMGKMIYAAYYNVPWQDVLTQFHFGNSELLLLSPDSNADDTHVFKLEQQNH